jgi:hypothetical protein
VIRLSVAGALLGAQDRLIVEAVFGEVVHLSLLGDHAAQARI